MNKRTFNVLRITKGIDRSRLWLRTLSIVVCVALLVTAISAWALVVQKTQASLK